MPTSRSAARDLIETAPLGDSLRALARLGEPRRYPGGSLLIVEGDVGDTLFIILDGRLRAFSGHPSNGREITYGVYGPGEYVGELGLDGGPRSASVAAVEASVCVPIRRVTLEAFIAAHPTFAFELLAKVIRRARAATLSLKQVALNDVYGRVKLLLEALVVDQPNGLRLVPEPLTDDDISKRIGCTREMVSRVMAQLRVGDFIERRTAPRRIVLLRALPPRW